MSQRVAAIVLAAGKSTRMGENKLLLPIHGVPMIVRAVDAALFSQACSTLVVVGHDALNVIQLLSECTTHIVHNEAFDSGMASSIRAGLNALPSGIDAVLILLGDMPYITAVEIDGLIDAHRAAPEAICVPLHGGQRGNPVLWPSRYFPELLALEGDEGARSLLARFADRVHAVVFDSPAVLQDCDTPDMLPQPQQPPEPPRPTYSNRY